MRIILLSPDKGRSNVTECIIQPSALNWVFVRYRAFIRFFATIEKYMILSVNAGLF